MNRISYLDQRPNKENCNFYPNSEFCLHHLLQWFRRQSIHPPQLLRVMAVWIQALSRNPMCPGECCQRCQSRNGPKMHPQTDFSFSLRDARDDATTYYCWCHPLLLLLRFPNYLLPLTSQAPPTQKPLKRDCSTTTHHKLLNYDFFSFFTTFMQIVRTSFSLVFSLGPSQLSYYNDGYWVVHAH